MSCLLTKDFYPDHHKRGQSGSRHSLSKTLLQGKGQARAENPSSCDNRALAAPQHIWPVAGLPSLHKRIYALAALLFSPVLYRTVKATRR